MSFTSENRDQEQKSENEDHSCSRGDKTCTLSEKKIISREWLFINRPEEENLVGLSVKVSFEEEQNYRRSKSVEILSKLRPFIPLTVEEVSFTVCVDNWSNHNVRLIGLFKCFDESENNYHMLESINEPGGTYKVLIDVRCLKDLPLINECIQIFGEIKIVNYKNCTRAVVIVSFFRNMESGNLLAYIKAVEQMKPYVPIYIKAENVLKQASCDDYDDYHFEIL